MDFLAHLHGGCYPAAIAPQLVTMVRRDRAGQDMLDVLDITRLALARLAEL